MNQEQKTEPTSADGAASELTVKLGGYALEQVREKLKAGGYDGLYYPGECGCEACDLAPCGNKEASKNGWINDCEPGYKHLDPRPDHAKFGDWAIFATKETPADEAWDCITY